VGSRIFLSVESEALKCLGLFLSSVVKAGASDPLLEQVRANILPQLPVVRYRTETPLGPSGKIF
jgi:hypothetical protein